MGLVDYSDSESDNEAPASTSKAPSQTNAKKPFQKIVDRSQPGKILVSLPQAGAADEPAKSGDEPAAKRIRVGGNRFSGFSSFLPPPKAPSKPALAKSSSGSSGGTAAPRIGVHLKTSSEAAFSRDRGGGDDQEVVESANGPGLSLPPPRAPAQPSIPAEQKPEEEVKLVGKPLMFKPLSVARKPGKKTASKAAVGKTVTAQSKAATVAAPQEETKEPPAKRKKMSLFSISDDPPTASAPAADETSYEPVYDGYDDGANGPADDLDNYQYDQAPPSTSYYPTTAAASAGAESLDTIADDLNLSAAARRELFGRGRSGVGVSASKVVNFNLDREYEHNEELRAAGEQQQTYNPVRAIAPGKHNLQQLVNAVQNQREALEETFAKNRETKNQAAGRYGWR